MSKSDWIWEYTPADSLVVLDEIATVFAHRAGPGRDKLLSWIKTRDYAAIVADSVPYHELSISESIAYRQVLGFYTKLDWLDLRVDKEVVAFRTFIEAESLCRETNEIFHCYSNGTFRFRPVTEDALSRARRKIRQILGRCPSLAELDVRFGPGATASTRRLDACPITKMAGALSCSEDLLASGRLSSALRELPHLTAAHAVGYGIDDDGYLTETVNVDVKHGKLVFVPKSAKTLRSIVVEPTLNTLFQSGIGDHIARRLKKYGVDIADQRPNQVLARLGSLTGEYATIDLSSASDTVSKGLCRFLLPSDWYDLLRSFRTSKVELSYAPLSNLGALVLSGLVDPSIDQHKFSSMGNGFTFPLETLIFYALSWSINPDTRAYGDDIICRSEVFPEVCSLLTTCGFRVNADKSFGSGRFRESCGADYLSGINIRPYYQKHLVSGASLFTMHNFFYRNLDEEACAVILNHIPEHLRLFGPDNFGDGHLLSSEWPTRRTRVHKGRGYGGLSFETYSRGGRSFRSPYPGDYVSPLYSIYVSSNSESRGVVYSEGGRVFCALPGTEGYKKVLIYYFG